MPPPPCPASPGAPARSPTTPLTGEESAANPMTQHLPLLFSVMWAGRDAARAVADGQRFRRYRATTPVQQQLRRRQRANRQGQDHLQSTVQQDCGQSFWPGGAWARSGKGSLLIRMIGAQGAELRARHTHHLQQHRRQVGVAPQPGLPFHYHHFYSLSCASRLLA